jgi:hypothetical protein
MPGVEASDDVGADMPKGSRGGIVARGLKGMDDHRQDARRKLSDYPISLRQSARAVFGNDYAREEQRDHDSGIEGRQALQRFSDTRD